MKTSALPGTRAEPHRAAPSAIMHVISGLKVGGAEMALLRLIVASRGHGYTHNVVALDSEGAMRERFLEAGIPLTCFDFKRSPVREFVRLVALIRRQRPDIVQTWLYHADFFGGLAARLAGVRRVMWGIHSVEIRNVGSPITNYVRRVNALLSRWVPRTIVSVATTARESHIEVGYDASRFVVIPNGFDIDQIRFDPERRRQRREHLGLLPHEHVIGWVGRFNAAKDCGTFLDAAGRVRRHAPNARFVMVGRDLVPENAELMNMAERAGVADRLLLCGEQRDVSDYLVAFDSFCMSSATEAFPLVLGEAMCMSLPCVATDVGDARVLLGDTGTLVPSRDPDRLADALLQMLTLPEPERRSLGERARERVSARFSLDATRTLYEAQYEHLMQHHGETI